MRPICRTTTLIEGGKKISTGRLNRNRNLVREQAIVICWAFDRIILNTLMYQRMEEDMFGFQLLLHFIEMLSTGDSPPSLTQQPPPKIALQR